MDKIQIGLLSATIILVVLELIISIMVLAKNKKTSQWSDKVDSKAISLEVYKLVDDKLQKIEENVTSNLKNLFEIEFKDINQKILNVEGNNKKAIDEFNKEFNQKINKQILEWNKSLENINKTNNDGFINLRKEINENLKAVKEITEQKMKAIKNDIDEHLKTKLDKKIDENFKSIDTKIKGLDESLVKFETLQSDVSNLNKVMSGVKSRGDFGEFTLEEILNEYMPNQFEKQFTIKGNNKVDFAIPFTDPESGKVKYLPVDSKFPIKNFEDYLEAANSEEQKKAEERLKKDIKKEAKSISEKYIDLDITPGQAVLYLPSEALYSLLISDFNLVKELSGELKIILAGPSTIMSIIALSKMSVYSYNIYSNVKEVEDVFDYIKNQYRLLNDKLDSAYTKTQNALKEIDGAKINVERANKKIEKSDNVLKGAINKIENQLESKGLNKK